VTLVAVAFLSFSMLRARMLVDAQPVSELGFQNDGWEKKN